MPVSAVRARETAEDSDPKKRWRKDCLISVIFGSPTYSERDGVVSELCIQLASTSF